MIGLFNDWMIGHFYSYLIFKWNIVLIFVKLIKIVCYVDQHFWLVVGVAEKMVYKKWTPWMYWLIKWSVNSNNLIEFLVDKLKHMLAKQIAYFLLE